MGYYNLRGVYCPECFLHFSRAYSYLIVDNIVLYYFGGHTQATPINLDRNWSVVCPYRSDAHVGPTSPKNTVRSLFTKKKTKNKLSVWSLVCVRVRITSESKYFIDNIVFVRVAIYVSFDKTIYLVVFRIFKDIRYLGKDVLFVRYDKTETVQRHVCNVCEMHKALWPNVEKKKIIWL